MFFYLGKLVIHVQFLVEDILVHCKKGKCIQQLLFTSSVADLRPILAYSGGIGNIIVFVFFSIFLLFLVGSNAENISRLSCYIRSPLLTFPDHHCNDSCSIILQFL